MFLIFCVLRPSLAPVVPTFWGIMYMGFLNGLLGVAIGRCLNEWEYYHQDWLDRHYYTEDETDEEETTDDSRN